MIFQNPWTPRIERTIHQAQKNIVELIGTRKGAKKIRRGAGGDMATKLDLRAEETIFAELESYEEDAVFISEELGKYYYDSREKKRLRDFSKDEIKLNNYFIIDPLDGSTNAARGIPFSSISIAYANGPRFSDIQSGSVINLATGDLYVAEKGRGAYLNGERIECSQIETLKNSVVAVAFKSMAFEKNLEKIQLKLLQNVGKIRIFGSCALECCLIGQGALDLYIDLREAIRTVDFAAGYLIVKEAGGFFSNGYFQDIESESLFLDNKFSIFVGTNSIRQALSDFYA